MGGTVVFWEVRIFCVPARGRGWRQDFNNVAVSYFQFLGLYQRSIQILRKKMTKILPKQNITKPHTPNVPRRLLPGGVPSYWIVRQFARGAIPSFQTAK